MIATTLNELHNDDVRVKIHRKNGCRVELDVTTSPSLLDKAKKQAIKSVGKEVSISGFRKGKAPEEMILRKYGSQIDKETQKQLADLAYMEAQKLARIPLLNNNTQISFSVKKQSPHEAELMYSFETEPEIPSVDPMLFEPKEVQKAEVGEKQIEEAVRQMRYFYAEWTPIEDRGIQNGDTITIDLDTMENDVPQRVFDHVRFEVSKDRMASWMKQLVEGAKAGDLLEGISQPDDTATEQEKKEFLPKKVRVLVRKVEEAKLPLLDDEFAKKVGASDVDAMRKSIQDMLEKQANDKVKDELRGQVNDFLTEKYAFELPSSLIETEKKHRLGQLAQNPDFLTNWEKMGPEERKKLEENLESEAAQAIRLFYLSRKIVADAKISISHKEIQDESIATLRSYGSRNNDKIPKEVYAIALSKLILAKAEDFILAAKKRPE